MLSSFNLSACWLRDCSITYLEDSILCHQIKLCFLWILETGRSTFTNEAPWLYVLYLKWYTPDVKKNWLCYFRPHLHKLETFRCQLTCIWCQLKKWNALGISLDCQLLKSLCLERQIFGVCYLPSPFVFLDNGRYPANFKFRRGIVLLLGSLSHPCDFSFAIKVNGIYKYFTEQYGDKGRSYVP